MKTFAFYLPQFHTIPENNQWWGDGFTEWTNVKKSVPLFYNHNQPRTPLNQNYYNLLDDNTLLWQSELLNKYKLDGLCFYHYWFSGRKILEKPAENLLKNKNINMPFFFSWANEPWTRSWDGLNNNILIEQNYGNKENWINHFNYLLPFFKDDRYVKHNGHPIFILYRSENFEFCKEWIKCWKNLAKENGLEDIHFVSSLTSFENDNRELGFDANLYFEPMNTTAHYFKKLSKYKIFQKKIKSINNKFHGFRGSINSFDYEDTWKIILNKKTDERTYAGAFIDWDNTPRKQQNGSVANNASPENFEKFFSLLYKKAKLSNTPYIFINAWNEWAEGAYLEPDTRYGYKYLEIIENIINQNS